MVAAYVTYLFLILAPLGCIAYGLFRWKMRRLAASAEAAARKVDRLEQRP